MVENLRRLPLKIIPFGDKKMNNKKYYIITIGCQMNKSDSERVASYLEDIGYKFTSNVKIADLVVLTTCGIRQSAEDRIYGLIPKIKKNNPQTKIILTGCLSDRDDVRKRMEKYVDIQMNIKELSKLKARLSGLNDDSIQRDCDYLKQKPKYSSKISAFVPIGNGCDNFCTYCVVPYARGREVYRESREIIEEVKNLVKNNYKEITLIAQNVNSYHEMGSKIDFPDLLKMVNDLEGDFWLRFATSHPKDMNDKLIETMSKCDKLCHHLHLPAQSGDNDILIAMNRKYKIGDYKKLIEKTRAKIPDISITTDIIVGFPGETREQFKNTKKLFREIKYDMAYIAQYSPRPNTVASKLDDDINREEKKRREKELMKILSKTALENNKQYLDKICLVLIEGKNKKGEWYGKTKTFKVVKIKNSKKIDNLKGEIVNVLINDVQDFGLRGEIVKK